MAALVKRIVCLANSFRQGGTCIAGREVLANGYGGWIRPVSARPSAELWLSECLYESNEFPKLLDLIDVPLLDSVSSGHQTENYIIDATRNWVKAGELSWRGLEGLEEHPDSLWIDRDRTRDGSFNCVDPVQAATLSSSLMLIRPRNAAVEVSAAKAFWMSFSYQARKYRLKLTDPIVIGLHEKKGSGVYPCGDVYLCVSLTLPFSADGRCHKLVAAVFSERSLV
jgi:hypothetical protein